MERREDQFDEDRDRRRETEDDEASVGTATEDRERDLDDEREPEDERAAGADAPDEAPGATPLPAGGPATTAPVDEQLTAPEDREAAAAADRGPAMTPPPASSMPSSNGEDFRVFEQGDLEEFRSQWDAIQVGFVDDPKQAAEQADALVGDLLRRLGERHAALRDELGSESDAGSDTEAMRTAVRQYRVFFRSIVTD